MFLLGYSSLLNAALPAKIPSTIHNASEKCQVYPKATRNAIIEKVIDNEVNPQLNTKYGRVCDCGGRGWTKVADIDMSNSSHNCPSSWNLYQRSGLRGCHRRNSLSNTCYSSKFPTNMNYARVCGRVTAYMAGDPDGFLNSERGRNTIDVSYVDGVSITHGPRSSRQHIWTFASADPGTGTHSCSCVSSNIPWLYQHIIPSFVGNNYFCDLGRPNTIPTTYYPNPLWDGEGCTSPSTCCQFNNPPWFCAPLPQLTSDPIEVRLCLSEGPNNEDLIITLVDIYVQ